MVAPISSIGCDRHAVTAKLHCGLADLTVSEARALSERGPDTDIGMPPGFPI